MSSKLEQIGLLVITPKFDKLIPSHKSTVFEERGLLDKNILLNNDWFDCLFMATRFFRFKNDELI